MMTCVLVTTYLICPRMLKYWRKLQCISLMTWRMKQALNLNKTLIKSVIWVIWVWVFPLLISLNFLLSWNRIINESSSNSYQTLSNFWTNRIFTYISFLNCNLKVLLIPNFGIFIMVIYFVKFDQLRIATRTCKL